MKYLIVTLTLLAFPVAADEVVCPASERLVQRDSQAVPDFRSLQLRKRCLGRDGHAGNRKVIQFKTGLTG